jgi:uncharacterized protein (DUF934 family)
MATLIKGRRIVHDKWQWLDAERWLQVGEAGVVPDFPDAADLIVPPKLWALRRDDLLGRSGRLGLRLEPGDDPAQFAADLERFDLVAVSFPKFGDGRGYSTAKLLRERYHYRGELRAIGQITRDLLYFMEKVGFDAYELREGEDRAEALAAFEDFSAAYQRFAIRGQSLNSRDEEPSELRL